MEKTISFEAPVFQFQKLIDDETALLKVKVCSSGDNAHGYPFTKETLIEAAERSLRGKAIVAKYSNFTKDFTTHTPFEVPLGYFIEHQTFEYVEEANGETSLYAYAIMWKKYASSEYEVFVEQKSLGKDPVKWVSMEILVNDKREGWNGDTSKTELLKFSFQGVTILGDRYTPASPGSNAKMIQFSKKKKKEIEQYFTEDSDKIKDSNDFLKDVFKEFGLAKNTAEKEGEKMSLTDKDNKDKDQKEFENAEEVKTDEVVVTEDNQDFGCDGKEKDMGEKETLEAEKEEESKMEESEEKEDEVDYKTEFEKINAELVQMKSENEAYFAELELLRSYKKGKEEAEKDFAIEEAIKTVSDILPNDVIATYREKAKEITFAETASFCNEIKARVVEFVDFKKEKNNNRMGIVTQEVTEPKKKIGLF